MPGVELSVKDGCNGIHTLVVFHEDWIDNREQADHINSFPEWRLQGKRAMTTGMPGRIMTSWKRFANWTSLRRTIC